METTDVGMLRLISKKGTRHDRKTRCSECKSIFEVVWLYAESNRGPVALCSMCKPVVFDRSFPQVDALDVAIRIGRFESNRKEH